MKNIIYTLLVIFAFVACEDQYETTHKYSRPYTLYKNYPIQLDAREILVNIQVKSPIQPGATFKIASNNNYFFVGEKMRGIHVYEKTDEFHAQPLCFIECQYIKAFDVVDNMLYCNNFVDLLAIDVENPLESKIKHREKNYFNKYNNSAFNFPNYYNETVDANVYEIGSKQAVLTGTETDTSPAPDFSELDELYGNIIVTQIPEALQVAKPYTGFVNVEGKLFTLGDNSLMQCSYTPAGFNITQSALNIPGYTSIYVDNLQYKDGVIFLFGTAGFIYYDYISAQSQAFPHWYSNALDMISLKTPANSFAVVWRGSDNYHFIEGIIVNALYNGFAAHAWGATSLVNVNDIILALGNQLTLYRFYLLSDHRYIEQVKQYSNISGTSMLKEDDKLIVANRQGLFFYDISDLEHITLVP